MPSYEECDEISRQILNEHEINYRDIYNVFSRQIFEYEIRSEQSKNDITSCLVQMLKARFLHTNRPPQIIFPGAPGSGRTY
jgi:hypothetical protein